MSDAMGSASGVDLNSASEQELEHVGGLGRERARRIVQSRPLASWDDVERIEGFGRKLTQDLQRAGARVGGRSGGSSGERSEHPGGGEQ